MTKFRKIAGITLGMSMAFAAAVQVQAADASLNIAYQYGLAYAPLIVAQDQGLIEAAYEEATGKTAEITWTQMSSGADINTGIAAGELDAGFLGVGPAITGVTKGVGYKIFTNLSGQEHGMMTNSEDFQKLEDLVGSNAQIALVNTGSIQHIILAKALDEAGLDAHALDANIVAMKHPDGMAALLSGSAQAHLTSSPYIFMEQNEEDLYPIEEVAAAWTADDSFIVGVASEELFDEDPELYTALVDGIAAAIQYVNDNPEETAALTCEYDGNTAEDELFYLGKGVYKTQTSGIMEMAEFMGRTGFIENAPEAFTDLVFDNVEGD